MVNDKALAISGNVVEKLASLCLCLKKRYTNFDIGGNCLCEKQSSMVMPFAPQVPKDSNSSFLTADTPTDCPLLGGVGVGKSVGEEAVLLVRMLV